MDLYKTYSPLVLAWLKSVLGVEGDEFMDVIRSGEVLCSLTTTLFPKIACSLSAKGDHFTIHKLVFFLEVCKSVGLKPSALCTLSDLIFGHWIDRSYSGCLKVLRTVVALERQARKRGFNGPALVLKKKGESSPELREDKPVILESYPTPETQTEQEMQNETTVEYVVSESQPNSHNPSPVPSPIQKPITYIERIKSGDFSLETRLAALYESESTHTTKLTQLQTLMNDILRKRRRFSKRLSSLPSSEQHATDLTQFDEDSSDVQLLLQIITDLKTEHEQLRDAISNCIDVAEQRQFIASLFLDFISRMQRKYIVYAVSVFADTSEMYASLAQGMEDRRYCLIDVIHSWIQTVNGDEGLDKTDWKTYMAFPVLRLKEYSEFLSLAANAIEGLEKRRGDLAKTKLDCTVKSIEKYIM